MSEEVERKSGHKKVLIVILLIVVLAIGGAFIWYEMQPKFHDLTIELGTESVSLSDFLNPYTIPGKVAFVSNPQEVNIDVIGSTQLILSYGKREEAVTLSVVDTTAPTVQFNRQVICGPGYIPKATEFITSVKDLSKTKVYYAKDYSTEDTVDDMSLIINVEDEGGNITSQTCVLKHQLLKDEHTLEYGEELNVFDIIYRGTRKPYTFSPQSIELVNSAPPGTYTLSGMCESKTFTCRVTIIDSKGPSIELSDVEKYVGQAAVLEDFNVVAEDLSGVKEVYFREVPTYTELGEYEVVICAKDNIGNISEAAAKLIIKNDDDPPEFSGLSSMSINKYSTPDYTSGVSAVDANDGKCSFTYNDSSVNTSSAGTYFVTYTATDKSGNKATAKRKVTVKRDSEDVAADIRRIASSLPDDPLALSRWIRRNVSYSSSYGGSNPVDYGLTNRTGNCYVHARLLQELLNEKGYSNKLIWTTDKSHYWNLVLTDDGWRHIDSTQGQKHPDRLMTDSDRLSNLQGREWDTSQWPACE